MQRARAFRYYRRVLVDSAFIFAGILSCTFALKGFLVPNRFFDGGTTGISLAIHALTGIGVGWLVLPLNLPLVIIASRFVNLRFAVKTLVCILGVSVGLFIVPVPTITADKMLVAVFGGVFMGLGSGLANRGGAAFDGLEIVSLFSARLLPLTTAEIALTVNALIFVVAARTEGLDHALYSMLIAFIGARVADFVVSGIDEVTRVTIVARESEAIKRLLVIDLDRAITVYKGERGFLSHDFETSSLVDIVVLVVTRLEVPRLRDRVRALDPAAFIFTQLVKEATGGVL